MTKDRPWVPTQSNLLSKIIATRTATQSSNSIRQTIDVLIERNREIHESECFNLNPASNVMNPRAESMLATGLGPRASLGYPGDKYEMGLEAIEEIELIAAQLVAEVFDAQFVEIRVPSGAMANLFGFMATCKPGDTIIAPPASIGGHVTHHAAGCAGLYGLTTIDAPVNQNGYTIDIAALRDLAKLHRPTLITVGGSLNLFEHPVREIRAIADEVGAKVMFDAAHQCGIIAGGAWKNPLQEGAHFMTMSTYKSLGGPVGGLIVSNDADLMERIDGIAYPGMTANFDAAKSAALAISMLDWREHGADYAAQMITVAKALADALANQDLPVFAAEQGYTDSHQFALEASKFGGGQASAKKLRQAGFLACGIGLPIDSVEGDLNGLRLGTPEIVRWGVTVDHVGEISSLIARGLSGENPVDVFTETKRLRKRFNTLHYLIT